MLRIVGRKPEDVAFVDALVAAAGVLDQWKCYRIHDRYHFPLTSSRWSIALSLDDARRVRVEACRFGHPRGSMWALLDNLDRLAIVVGRMSQEVAEPV